jgi:hypothetical protein
MIALLLGGCASIAIEPAGLEQPLQTASIAPLADAGEAARGELRKVQHKAVEEARRPVQAFLAEKSANCASARLKEAASKVTETARAAASTMKPDYAAMLEAGAAVLDVADGAKRRGCGRDARELYEFVLKNFAGLGYAELRERATVGIRELKSKGQLGTRAASRQRRGASLDSAHG